MKIFATCPSTGKVCICAGAAGCWEGARMHPGSFEYRQKRHFCKESGCFFVISVCVHEGWFLFGYGALVHICLVLV
jgi:hypothetical protein